MMFREPLAAAIVTGRKTATRRQPSDNPRSPWAMPIRSYPVGKRFTINPGRGVSRVAEAEVTGRYTEWLGMTTLPDAQREGFASIADFVAAWTRINGTFNAEERVHVIEFKLAGTDCGRCAGEGLTREFHGRTAIPKTCTACFGTGIEVGQAGRELVARVNAEAEA